MAKSAKPVFFCGECGYETSKWLGNCPGCGAWNTIIEAASINRSSSPSVGNAARPLCIIDSDNVKRFTSGMEELDRVLGGGFSPGMVVLIGGDPGVGKSTLLLQAAGHISKSIKVMYVSGEESASQVKSRAERLKIETDMLLLNEMDIGVIEAEIQTHKPEFMVIDSIQTMYVPELSGNTGSISQVRESTAALTKIAKQFGIAMVIVGHVTKDGAIAGPRILEHMVDTVLYFEGERLADYRLVRAVKNRYGSTNEIGVFEMRESGMAQVSDPSKLFLSGQHLPGCSVACVMEGTRPMLVEIQALLSYTVFGTPRRTAAGIDAGRLALMLAVLENKARVKLSDKDAYINVMGGLKIAERSADLAIALCIASCSKNTPLGENTVAIGEVGLTGEIRAVSHMEKRIAECVRLGFKNIIVPRSDGLIFKDINLIPARNIAEAVALI